MTALIVRLKSIFARWLASTARLTPQHGWLLAAPAVVRARVPAGRPARGR
jgi:hypothetical protein